MKLRVALAGNAYPIYLREGALDDAAAVLRQHAPAPEYVVVSDDTVDALYGDTVIERIRPLSERILRLKVSPGEGSKSSGPLNRLYTRMIEDGVTRRAVVIALGGGVVGDLAGYVSATYLRGIRLVQIPTTLLSQVDSSIGGKVGINHSLGKNLIGAFHQPRCVIIDPALLRTLAARELRAGMAEVVKSALIRDPKLYRDLSDRLEELLELRDMRRLERVIAACCRIKAGIVRRDEREAGERALLNFGHTVGHALESATQYSHFLHGEAVTHGMRTALHLSGALGILQQDPEPIDRLLQRLRPAPLPGSIDVDMLIKAMERDKKRALQGQLWIVLKRAGEALMTREVGPDRVRDSLAALLDDTF